MKKPLLCSYGIPAFVRDLIGLLKIDEVCMCEKVLQSLKIHTKGRRIQWAVLLRFWGTYARP